MKVDSEREDAGGVDEEWARANLVYHERADGTVRVLKNRWGERG